VELARQLLVRRVVLGDDHDAGRPLVQPMDDARPQLSANAAEIGHVMEQRVDERAPVMPRAWMDDHPRRFVDNDDVRVLEQHLQREVLCRRRCRHRRGQDDGDHVAFAHLCIGFDDLHARERDVAFLDQPLDLRSRIAGDLAGQDTVDAQTLVLGLDEQLEACRLSFLSVGGEHPVTRGSREARLSLARRGFNLRRLRRAAQIPQHDDAERR
jgi:hypothetical protein